MWFHRENRQLKISLSFVCSYLQGLVGGKKTADPNDERVREMAKFAVSQLDAQSNSLNSQKLVTVKEAQTQVKFVALLKESYTIFARLYS